MTLTASELEERLREVEDPDNGDDVVSMGLVNDVAVGEEEARVSLAFNAPYSPTEMDIGNAIRDVVEDAGLEPDLRASVGEDQGFDEDILPGVKNVVAVASGKGGVGKTTVAANLAAGLNDRGARVGILDADVHGPNVPRLLPTENEPGVTPNEEIVPPASDGVRVMSTDHMMPDGDDPAVLRGPMVNNVMMKFINEVEWGRLDYLVVDLPPGTGDASLNLLQTLPLAGVVVVTTPQEMAVADARKGLKLFEQHDAPVLGVVENMAAFQCPDCGDTHRVFGEGGGAEIRDDYDVPVLAELPVHPDFDSGDMAGPTIREEDSEIREDLFEMVDATADRIGEVNRRRVAQEVGLDGQESVPTDDAAAADGAGDDEGASEADSGVDAATDGGCGCGGHH